MSGWASSRNVSRSWLPFDGEIPGDVLEAHPVAGQSLGRGLRGKADAAGLLSGRDRRLRDEGRLDRDGRVSGRLEVGTGRGTRRRAPRGHRVAGRGVDGRSSAGETAEPDMND